MMDAHYYMSQHLAVDEDCSTGRYIYNNGSTACYSLIYAQEPASYAIQGAMVQNV